MSVGNIANTGLKAAMTNMESISNNIANANTVGFKKSHINFADIYAGGFSENRQVGFGVRSQSISQDFSLGRIELTDRGLDLSLSNDGFFVQKNSAGQTSYTRAGRFELDKDGYFMGLSGRVQGFAAVDGKVNASKTLSDLKLSDTTLPAKPTTNAMLALNLDASATPPTSPFNETDTTSYNYRTDTTVYDSLGKAYNASVFYIKASDNNWTTQVVMDNKTIGTGNMAFQNNGTLSAVTGLDNLSWTPSSGATTPQNLTLKFDDSTQFSGESKTNKSDQDGYQAGIPSNFNIDGDGKIMVYYSNGQSQLQGQIAIARFKAPQGLDKTENMSWFSTADSGEPIFGEDNNAISSGTLELSNVDLTEELVKLMGAQHDFQANAQVTQTYNQILQTIQNM